MDALAVAAAFGALLGAGFGALSLIGSKNRYLTWPEVTALSWVLGSGAVSLALWILGFILHGIALQATTTMICLALALAGWRRATGICQFHQADLQRLVYVPLAALVIQILIVFYASFKHPLGWDGLFNWEIKARLAFFNNGILPSAYVQNPGLAFTNTDYPLCIPFTELWLYLWLGEPNQFWAKLIFPAYYTAGALLIVGLGWRLTGRMIIGLAAAILLFFIPQFVTEVGSAIVGYADLPLAVAYLATVGFLVIAAGDKSNSAFAIYLACLSLLPWIKSEGAILWTVAAALGIIVVATKRRPITDYVWIASTVVLLLSWKIYLLAMRPVSNESFLPVSMHSLLSNLNRLPGIVTALAHEFINVRSWSLFWPITAMSCGLLLKQSRDLRVLLLISALLAPICLDCCIYIFSGWNDYRDHIALSLNRLLMQVALLGIMAAMLAFAWRARTGAVVALAARTCRLSRSERTPAVARN